jgi:thiol-disulfide isomerase/thioredoxin
MLGRVPHRSKALALAVAASGCGPLPVDAPSTTCAVEVGKRPCEIEGTRLSGDGPATIADARGKVVIVDFWATTCKPYKKSFPLYQHLLDTHPSELAMIAVSTDSPEDVHQAEVSKLPPTCALPSRSSGTRSPSALGSTTPRRSPRAT